MLGERSREMFPIGVLSVDDEEKVAEEGEITSNADVEGRWFIEESNGGAGVRVRTIRSD